MEPETSEPGQHALPASRQQKLLPASTGGDGGNGRGGPWRKLLLGLILLAIAAIVFWKVQGNKKEAADTAAKTTAAADRAIPVTVAPVQSKTMPIYLTALGTVTAYNTVTIKSRVDGQLLSVNVREGQQVKHGQVLATIDPRPYLATQAQAEGQLAKDEASAAYSKSEAARYTALFEAGVVSKESEQTQVSNAGASAGTLAADRAAIQAARVNVAYTRIASPINGVVGLRQVDAGNIVHASDAGGLLVVTQLQPITVIFTMPEDQIPEVLKLIRAGRKLLVDAYDRAEVTHLASGTLLTVDNQIDPTTGTVKAKAVFENKDNALFPNQFVNIRLILEQRQNSLVVPAAALQTGTNGSYVYVAKPGDPPQSASEQAGTAAPDGGSGTGKAPGGHRTAGGGVGGSAAGGSAADGSDHGPKYYVEVQNVSVDLTEGAQIILKGGVKPGDLVVIDGQEKLRRYSKVTPRQGRSNGGGPATQAIGSDGSSASAPPQPGDGSKTDTAQPGAGRKGRAGSPQSGQANGPAGGRP